MIEVPDPGDPLHEAYLTASSWCAHIPSSPTLNIREDCIVGTIASIATREHVLSELLLVAAAAAAVAASFTAFMLLKRRRTTAA